MLILRKVTKDEEGQWFDFDIRKETIRLKIRPLSSDILEGIRNKNKKVGRELDPATRAMVKVDKYDEDKINKEIVDFILDDFEGVGSDLDTPLENTPENKEMVMEIPPVDEEISVADFVFDTAKRLAAMSEEDFREQEKN